MDCGPIVLYCFSNIVPARLQCTIVLSMLSKQCTSLPQGLKSPEVKIKWPNDLYSKGLKVGGVLCTSTYSSKKFNIVVGEYRSGFPFGIWCSSGRKKFILVYVERTYLSRELKECIFLHFLALAREHGIS